jgi:hypothetical protein
MNWVLTAVLLKVESLDVVLSGKLRFDGSGSLHHHAEPLQDGVIFVCVIGSTVKSYSPTDAVGCCVVMSAVIMCCVCSFTGCGEETCTA